VVLTSHDADRAADCADEVVVLAGGVVASTCDGRRPHRVA